MTTQTPQEKVNATVAHGSSQALAIRDAMKMAIPQIGLRLPKFLGDSSAVARRYAAIAIGTIQDTAGLQDCTPASLVRAVIRAAEYGLAVDGVLGHAYLVPYKHGSIKQAQFQLGYRGIAELMYRTGMWESIATDVVCKVDIFEYEKGLVPVLKHKPPLGGRGKPPGVSEGGTRVATYAIAYPKGGGIPTFVVLDEDKVLEHRACSMAFKSDPKKSIWGAHPDVAWIKSAMRELSKCVSMATDKHSEMRRATIVDERIDRGDPAIVEAEVVVEPAVEEVKAGKTVKSAVDECPPGEAINMQTGEKV